MISGWAVKGDYGYSATDGRFKGIGGPGLAGYVNPDNPGYGVECSRLADSDLLEYTRFKSATDTYVEVRRGYEANRDLVWYVQNEIKPAGGSRAGILSRYEYHNDELGRRTAEFETG